MSWYRNGIRGPTGPKNMNGRAGNAAVHEIDQGGSGINQPSRVPRYIRLAPTPSVGGEETDVKISSRDCGHIVMRATLPRQCLVAWYDGVYQSAEWQIGVAGNRAGLFARPIPAPLIRRKWDGFR